MTFREEIELLRRRRDARAAVLRGGDPEKAEAELRKDLAKARTRAAETSAQLAAEKSSSRIYGLSAQPYPVQYQPVLCTCPEPERKWYFDYEGPQSTVIGGAVGYDNIEIVNNDSGASQTQQFWMHWRLRVPRDGTFSYWPTGYRADLAFNWRLDGSGLWGEDARLKVKSYSWVTVGNDNLAGWIGNHLDRTKSTSFASSGSVTTTIPVCPGGMFRAVKGEVVNIYTTLQVSHWADGGFVYMFLDRFYLLRNYDVDHMFALTD